MTRQLGPLSFRAPDRGLVSVYDVATNTIIHTSGATAGTLLTVNTSTGSITVSEPGGGTQGRAPEVEQGDAAHVVHRCTLGDPAQLEEAGDDVDLGRRPLAGAKDGGEILVVRTSEGDEHAAHFVLMNDVLELRAIPEERKDGRAVLPSPQESNRSEPELLMLQEGRREADRKVAFPDDQGALRGDAPRLRRSPKGVRDRPSDDHRDRAERRDPRQAAQVGWDVDPREPENRPDRHEEQQGQRDATQQPRGVVAETGVDPEDARGVAIEDQEGEDGEHDPDRTGSDQGDRTKADEHTHASERGRVGEGQETRKGRTEPKGARWLENHSDGFANSHRSRTAARRDRHGSGDRVLHAPSSS